MTDTNRVALDLSSRWMNQAGTLGYSPTSSGVPEKSIFVTNPVCARARVPSTDRNLIPFPGGFLLHTGLPNAGWNSIRSVYAEHWAQATVPVWVHVFSQDTGELEQVVRDCEELEGVAAIELGLPPACPRDWMLQLIRAARGELPLVLHISHGEDLALFRNLPDEVAAVTLGTPRGSLPAGNTRKLIHGRLHGPGLFPLLLEGLINLKQMDIPIILGGICNRQDAKTALQCGAAAVQMDYLCWNENIPEDVTTGN